MDRETFVRQAVEHDEEIVALRKAEAANNAKLRASKLAHAAAQAQLQAAQEAERQAGAIVGQHLSEARNLLHKLQTGDRRAKQEAGRLFDAGAEAAAIEERETVHAAQVSAFRKLATAIGL